MMQVLDVATYKSEHSSMHLCLELVNKFDNLSCSEVWHVFFSAKHIWKLIEEKME